ncbi:hypothetical protein [Mycoplasma bradburyae]|uniref:Uncharacterized protein n=1 Tax=Mycoplasma bradburyae TaxID=2963128 RepID=A0ABT5GCH4_9MOLU|nr:hypothetical protein [Mycoplasma bradburyae]MDC4182091.1 hypothetical protein [Mycoplasma bradburyae]UTS69835.1 hypothetical protein NMG68_02295 [Mycoplasma bradburyae]
MNQTKNKEIKIIIPYIKNSYEYDEASPIKLKPLEFLILNLIYGLEKKNYSELFWEKFKEKYNINDQFIGLVLDIFNELLRDKVISLWDEMFSKKDDNSSKTEARKITQKEFEKIIIADIQINKWIKDKFNNNEFYRFIDRKNFKNRQLIQSRFVGDVNLTTNGNSNQKSMDDTILDNESRDELIEKCRLIDEDIEKEKVNKENKSVVDFKCFKSDLVDYSYNLKAPKIVKEVENNLIKLAFNDHHDDKVIKWLQQDKSESYLINFFKSLFKGMFIELNNDLQANNSSNKKSNLTEETTDFFNQIEELNKKISSNKSIELFNTKYIAFDNKIYKIINDEINVSFLIGNKNNDQKTYNIKLKNVQELNDDEITQEIFKHLNKDDILGKNSIFSNHQKKLYSYHYLSSTNEKNLLNKDDITLFNEISLNDKDLTKKLIEKIISNNFFSVQFLRIEHFRLIDELSKLERNLSKKVYENIDWVSVEYDINLNSDNRKKEDNKKTFINLIEIFKNEIYQDNNPNSGIKYLEIYKNYNDFKKDILKQKEELEKINNDNENADNHYSSRNGVIKEIDKLLGLKKKNILLNTDPGIKKLEEMINQEKTKNLELGSQYLRDLANQTRDIWESNWRKLRMNGEPKFHQDNIKKILKMLNVEEKQEKIDWISEIHKIMNRYRHDWDRKSDDLENIEKIKEFKEYSERLFSNKK